LKISITKRDGGVAQGEGMGSSPRTTITTKTKKERKS
jgi:hypothetical protein